MSTYKKYGTAVLIATTLAFCAFAQALHRPELTWDDLAQWHGADVSNAEFVRFVRDYQLILRNDDECGTFADAQESFWMNIRKKHVVRVSVRIRPTGPSQNAFNGKLVADVGRDDTVDTIIRTMGSPAYDVLKSGAGGRYLAYGPNHLVFDFDKDGMLFEIRHGEIDAVATPNKAVNVSRR